MNASIFNFEGIFGRKLDLIGSSKLMDSHFSVIRGKAGFLPTK